MKATDVHRVYSDITIYYDFWLSLHCFSVGFLQ